MNSLCHSKRVFDTSSVPARFAPDTAIEQLSDERLRNEIQEKLRRFSKNQPGLPALKTICFHRDPACKKEAFRLSIGTTRIEVSASDAHGDFHAAQTLMRLMEDFPAPLPCGEIFDEPLLAFRAAKLYLPPPTEAGFAEFRSLVDLLCRFRYNTLMLEIGGALEYKRHPEINEGWIEYAAFMNEYSGKAQTIQHSCPWNKNAIHAGNGGGRFLTQEQMKELLNYCRERHIEVIPELPSLSHCDYLLTRHRELAERPEDPFPDTACPNHPGYYPLLFDLIDEIIDVFHPLRMHLGHDEYYSIALCPRCKGIPAEEIFARDLRRCHAYLQSRGVRMMVWSEKLLQAHFADGYPLGGSEVRVWHDPDGPIRTAPTWPAIDKIPTDIEMMHWYWSIDRNLEAEYIKRGMPMIFGNMSYDCMPDWDNRRRAANLLGCCSSNWGDSDLMTLQRNGFLYDLAFGSILCWNATCGEKDFECVRDTALDELYAAKRAFSLPGTAIELRHCCAEARPFRFFYDGHVLEEANDLLGYHIFQNESGQEFRFPVIYGSNIASSTLSMERGPLEKDLPDEQGNLPARYQDLYSFDRRAVEASWSTRPELVNNRLCCRSFRLLPDSFRQSGVRYAGFEPVPGFSEPVELLDFSLIEIH